MFVLELLIAVAVALLLAAVLVFPLRRRGPGPLEGLLFFFLIIFLAAWAGGLWLTPIGPVAYGVPWVGFVVVGVILALILAAAATPRRRLPKPGKPAVPRTEAEAEVEATPPEVKAGEAVAVTLGVLFYLALFAMLLTIILHYAWWRPVG